MASLFSLTALGFALISIAQVSNSLLITRTVHRSCSITTTATLPACGWISASGSSRPYCFSTTAPSQSSALSQSSPGIPTSSSRATSTVVLPPVYSTPSAISSSRFVISVTVTPFPSSSDTSSFASSSTSVVLVTVTPFPSVSSTASSSLLLPPVYTAPAVVTTTTTTNAASINTIPTSTTSLLSPPIYTSQPSSINTLPSSSLTTIVTIISPPDYENPSTSSSSALLPPGYENPSTTTSSAIPPPGYENPSTTAITSSQSSIPTDVGYCFRDGALLDVNVNITITDNLGGVYVLLCTSTSLGVSIRGGNFLGSVQAPNSVDDCFPICDANPNCTGFTFQSIAPWGVGPGACSFYQGVGLFFDAVAEADLIAFIRVPLLSSRGIDDGWGGMTRTRRTIRDAV